MATRNGLLSRGIVFVFIGVAAIAGVWLHAPLGNGRPNGRYFIIPNSPELDHYLDDLNAVAPPLTDGGFLKSTGATKDLGGIPAVEHVQIIEKHFNMTSKATRESHPNLAEYYDQMKSSIAASVQNRTAISIPLIAIATFGLFLIVKGMRMN